MPRTVARQADERLVGIVLAGGGSRRLGRDKTALRIGGSTLPERAAMVLAQVCDELAVADAGRGLVTGRLSLADAAVRGPVGGILGAADSFPHRALLILACDTPNVPASLLADLARPRPADWVVPRWQRGTEPLCALYRPNAIARLRELAAGGEPAPHRLAAVTDLQIHWLEGPQLGRHGHPEWIFHNLNTPEDVEDFGLPVG